MKNIIFFDGDGTIWYPKVTKRKEKPYWIYYDQNTKHNFLEHLELVPDVKNVLTTLKKSRIRLILLSTHPDSLQNADIVLKSKIEHFGLNSYFDEFHVSAEYPAAKGEKILELLNSYKLEKKDALMVGDSYFWDYKSASDCGVDAVLIDSDYHRQNIKNEPAEKVISGLNELDSFIK